MFVFLKVLMLWCIMDMFFCNSFRSEWCSGTLWPDVPLQHSKESNQRAAAFPGSGQCYQWGQGGDGTGQWGVCLKPLRWLRLLCSWLKASFSTWLSRRMRMNSLHLRVDNRLLVLSVHVLTLDENWRMRSDCCAVCLFKYRSHQKHLQYSPNVCVCVCFS